jgi:hypothetical protein
MGGNWHQGLEIRYQYVELGNNGVAGISWFQCRYLYSISSDTEVPENLQIFTVQRTAPGYRNQQKYNFY